MVAAMAAPLAEKGAKFGVQIGTAYLFTQEAVQSGAIVPSFQKVARDCAETSLLQNAPGHSTRCAKTDYVVAFQQERARLDASGLDTRETWARLEEFNLGRLRIASKGLVRKQGDIVEVEAAEQRRDGLCMMGQVAALRQGISSISELHRDISEGSTERLSEIVLPMTAANEETPPLVAGEQLSRELPQVLEYAPEFDLARVSWLAFDLALATLHLGLHHRDAGAVHLDVKDGHGGGTNLEKFQLLGAADLFLLALSDIGANGFRPALDGLGGEFQSGQQLQLLPAPIKAGLTAYQRHHPTHAGRKLLPLHVQFLVPRAVALVVMRADLIGPFQLDRSQYGEQPLGAVIVVAGLPSTSTGHCCGMAAALAQQSRQHGRTSPMKARAGRHLDRLQVESMALPLGRKDYLEKRLDFPCDFLMNSSSRFFSASLQPVGSGSAGRRRQIRSLRAVSSALSS